MHFTIRAALITSLNELFTKAVTVVLRGILSYTSRVKNHLDLVLYKLNPSLMQVAAQQEQQDWASNEIEGSYPWAKFMSLSFHLFWFLVSR